MAEAKGTLLLGEEDLEPFRQFIKMLNRRDRSRDGPEAICCVDEGNTGIIGGLIVPESVTYVDSPVKAVAFHDHSDVFALRTAGVTGTFKICDIVVKVKILQEKFDIAFLAVGYNAELIMIG